LTDRAPVAPDLGVYIHWPYCARICPYCDFNVVRDRGRADEQAALAEAIVADIAAQAGPLAEAKLVSIFFGGGTPSLMDPALAARIVEAARAWLRAAPDLEVTLEANPTDAETARFAAFRDAGVNRLSLGVQSLDDAALAFLGRNHDAAEARRAAEVARRVFPRLSIDLIYALPGQTPAPWRAGLAAALALGPEHVSAYQLTVEPGTPFDRAVARGRWAPAEGEWAACLFETTGETLAAAGYDAYEVSNHARSPVARSRHNLLYWRGAEWLGVGPGAHGRLTLGGARWATETPRKIADYVAQVATTGCGVGRRERLSPRAAAQERLLMGLRTIEGVALEDLAPLAPDPALLRNLAEAGLIEPPAARLIATAKGRAVLDRITLELAGAAAAG
jgi:putative oxygen-independent coproporphyrinogen III oxidase